MFERDDGGELEYAIDCSFRGNEFRGEDLCPYLCINSIETTTKNVSELRGKSYDVQSIEEADEREDTFYIYEHEPIANYHLTILKINGNKAHIRCVGIAVIDGYAEPYEAGKFELDCWLPIITNKEDWTKFGL